MDNEIGIFEKAVARAEDLGRFAREAAEKSIRASQTARRRAEEIGKTAQQAAKAETESLRQGYRAGWGTSHSDFGASLGNLQ